MLDSEGMGTDTRYNWCRIQAIGFGRNKGMGTDTKYNWFCIQAIGFGGNRTSRADPAVLSPRRAVSACVLQLVSWAREGVSRCDCDLRTA